MSDDQFLQLNKRFDEQDTVILRLYQHMERRFDEFEARLDSTATHEELDRVYKLLDRHIKQWEANEQERLALVHQLDRHSGWIKQLANHTNAKLVPDP